jgi:hypothetical protein
MEWRIQNFPNDFLMESSLVLWSKMSGKVTPSEAVLLGVADAQKRRAAFRLVSFSTLLPRDPSARTSLYLSIQWQ